MERLSVHWQREVCTPRMCEFDDFCTGVAPASRVRSRTRSFVRRRLSLAIFVCLATSAVSRFIHSPLSMAIRIVRDRLAAWRPICRSSVSEKGSSSTTSPEVVVISKVDLEQRHLVR